MNAESKTAKVITGITREEWLRRFEVARKKSPKDKSDKELHSNAELEKLHPVAFRDRNKPDTVYRLSASFTAGAELVDAPKTPKDYLRLARKGAAEDRAEIARRRPPLTRREKRVLKVICETTGLSLRAYVDALDAAGVRTSKKWQDKKCPKRYGKSYSDAKWRHEISRERSKLKPLQ